MMKSNNDDFLDWPFKGRISFRLINPAFPHLSQVDTMVTRPDLAAFQRPTTDICTRGFGFATYISANDIKYKGFMSNDSLQILIKIQSELISPWFMCMMIFKNNFIIDFEYFLSVSYYDFI